MTLELLDRATKYKGLNKRKFIRQSIREKSETIIAEHEKTHFIEADWKMFFSLLDKPLEVTDRMKKARKKYSKIAVRKWKPALNRFIIEFEERLHDYR